MHVDHFVERRAAAGGSKKTRSNRPPASGDARFASTIVPSIKLRAERTMPSVAGSTRPTTFSTRLDSLIARSKLPVMPRHRRKEEIPEGMSAEAFAFRKAIPKEIGYERLIVGERDQAVTNVAGRKHA